MHRISLVADQLTIATRLVAQNEFEKAEEVMNQVPPVLPQSAALYSVIGDQHARRGEWPVPITNYLRAIRADPTNHFAYHLLTPLLLETGDLGAYREHRQKMLLHFSGTSDPIIAHRISRDCLLLPPNAGDLEVITRMADTAVASGPGTNGWVRMAKGLAEYRQGHLEDPSNWLQEAYARSVDPALQLQIDMVMAMTQFKMKQFETARATLAAGIALAQAEVPARIGVNWNDRRTGYLLMSEASALIKEAPSAVEKIK